MSGLLEMIARRRRASASRRLGPASQNGLYTFDNNGAPQTAPPEPAVAPEEEPVAAPELEQLGSEAQPEAVAPPAQQAVAPPAPEPVVVEAQPEPEPQQSPVPPVSAPPTAEPGFLERGRVRRRARYLRQLRELQLRDIGGFLFESGRFERERPELLGSKLAAVAETHRELHELERVLGKRRPVTELREAGIGGACEHCGEIFGSRDRFCSSCGKPV